MLWFFVGFLSETGKMLEDNSSKMMHDHFRDHKPAAIRTTFGLEVNIFPYTDFFSFHFFLTNKYLLTPSMPIQ